MENAEYFRSNVINAAQPQIFCVKKISAIRNYSVLLCAPVNSDGTRRLSSFKKYFHTALNLLALAWFYTV